MDTCIYCRQAYSNYFKIIIDVIINDNCKSLGNNVLLCTKCYHKDDLPEILQGVLLELILPLTHKKNIRHLITPDPAVYYKTDPHINYSIIYAHGLKIHHSYMDLQYSGQSFRLYKIADEIVSLLRIQFHDYV